MMWYLMAASKVEYRKNVCRFTAHFVVLVTKT